MSKAGRPSQRKNGNGPEHHVPPNIEWDEENPPFVYNCTQHTEHHPQCNGECGGKFYLESEVALANIGREYARIGMNHRGIIEAYRGVIPMNGMGVDPFDLLMWVETIKQVLTDADLIDAEAFDEIWRTKKIDALQQVYDHNAPMIKEAHAKAALGIVEKRLLGPDGQPLT